MKVRVNHLYRFEPVLLDRLDARTNLQPGDVVRVVNLPGCPPCNTMRHAHVADRATGEFIGLVHTNSLKPIVRRTHRIRAVNMAKAILSGVDAGDFSLTVARDAMDSIAVCPESVRVEELA